MESVEVKRSWIDKIAGNEEISISLIGGLAFFMLLAGQALAGNLDWAFVIGMAAYAIALLCIGNYLQARGRHAKDKRYDERKALIMRLSARNGYAVALLAIGIAAMAAGSGYLTWGLFGILTAVYLLAISAQFVSYLYYLGKGPA